MKRSDHIRFWEKVRIGLPEECWNWTACTLKSGYGRMAVNKTQMLAHRIAYMIHFGEIESGIYICHKCDNPSCVNPAHLFKGSPLDNATDRDSKGRGINPPYGAKEKHPLSKIRAEDLPVIRKLLDAGWQHKIISSLFGVSAGTISKISTGTHWTTK